MCTWVGMCCGFFTIYLTGTLGDVFGFFPTLMSNAQASPRPEPRAVAPRLAPRPTFASPVSRTTSVLWAYR
mgnify:CR=1 FL=1